MNLRILAAFTLSRSAISAFSICRQFLELKFPYAMIATIL